jgi:hypothetical protein
MFDSFEAAYSAYPVGCRILIDGWPYTVAASGALGGAAAFLAGFLFRKKSKRVRNLVITCAFPAAILIAWACLSLVFETKMCSTGFAGGVADALCVRVYLILGGLGGLGGLTTALSVYLLRYKSKSMKMVLIPSSFIGIALLVGAMSYWSERTIRWCPGKCELNLQCMRAL